MPTEEPRAQIKSPDELAVIASETAGFMLPLGSSQSLPVPKIGLAGLQILSFFYKTKIVRGQVPTFDKVNFGCLAR